MVVLLSSFVQFWALTVLGIVATSILRLSLVRYVFKCGWLKAFLAVLASGLILGIGTAVLLLVIGGAFLFLWPPTLFP